MSLLQAIILGVVQGLTEFLPVSSSGHLVLFTALLKLKPNVAFDVILHLGTLLAVLAYYRKDIIAIILGIFGRGPDPLRERRLALYIIIGTVPAAALGLAFGDFIESLFSSLTAVGFFLTVTAALLYFSSKQRVGGTEDEDMGLGKAALVGLAQALAIAPGISRSGSTIAAGLWAGLSREEAARFSFLLSIPVILGAGATKIDELFKLQAGDLMTYGIGFIAAALAGYAAIALLIRLLRMRDLLPFAWYCLAVGLITIGVSLLA